MNNPLSKLVLDYWYKVLMVVGIVVFILSGTGLLKAFPTVPTSLIFLGIFWVGLGEWVNHPLKTSLQPRNISFPGGVLTGHPRNPKIIGVTFDFIGGALIIFGGYKYFT